MRKLCLAALVFALIGLPGEACAGAGIALNHALVGYFADAEGVTLDYDLQVRNLGDEPLQDLVLDHVPLRHAASAPVTLAGGSLPAGSAVGIGFRLVVETPIDEAVAAQMSLSWAGSYSDPAGEVVEFPAVSTVVPAEAEGGVE